VTLHQVIERLGPREAAVRKVRLDRGLDPHATRRM
jgi:hypothetical protein